MSTNFSPVSIFPDTYEVVVRELRRTRQGRSCSSIRQVVRSGLRVVPSARKRRTHRKLYARHLSPSSSGAYPQPAQSRSTHDWHADAVAGALRSATRHLRLHKALASSRLYPGQIALRRRGAAGVPAPVPIAYSSVGRGIFAQCPQGSVPRQRMLDLFQSQYARTSGGQ